MTTKFKKNLLIFLSIIVLLLVISFALYEMSKAISSENSIKFDIILKLLPTYILLLISISKSIYEIINHLFPIPKFIFILQKKMSSHNLIGDLVVTNKTNRQIKLINIQSKFYNTATFSNTLIDSNKIERIPVEFNYEENQGSLPKNLIFKVVYKTNDSERLKSVRIKFRRQK